VNAAPDRRHRLPRLTGSVAVLALALLLLGLALGFRPVVITTGSMSPAVPAGSLVITRERPTSHVAVGDVIVMDRARSITVTHRVVEISETSTGRQAVTQGDANATADPDAYPLDRPIPVVVRAIPSLGRLIVAFRSPLSLALLALAAVAWLWTARRAAPQPATSGRSDRPRRGASAAWLLLMGGIGAATISSLALFTDSEIVSGDSFTMGTLDISASPASAVVAMAGMAPGDHVTAPLRVVNQGTLELRYSLRSTTTEDVLANLLVLSVKAGVQSCDDVGWSSTGAVLYTGPLGSAASIDVLGVPAPGADPGDRVLAAAASETLCLRVDLPLTVSNVAQGLSTSATFRLDAEQTANNP